MADLGTLTAYLRADMRDLQTKLVKATKNIRTFSMKVGVQLRGVSTAFGILGRAVKKLGGIIKRQLKYIGIAAIAALGASVKAFASFEEQLANVSTMLDDHTMKYMPKYAKQLKNIAVEFGEGTSTLTKGLYDILSASIAPAKAMNVLRTSSIAAKAGLTNTGIAADAITTILNSYQMSADEAGKVSDWLFAIVKRGKTTFAELAPNIGKVTATAAAAGLSFEQLGAAIATMTRAGLQTDLATTSMRGLLNAFLKPGGEAIEMAKQFGFELNTATLRTIGLTGVLKKLKGATAEQLAALIPNVRGLAGLAAALNQAEGMLSDYELMLHSTGLTQKAFAKMTDTLAFQLKRLWQAIKIISVGIGERFKGSIIDLSNAIIKNQRIIESWAIAFADRIVFIKDVLFDFLKLLKTDFHKGFQAILDSLIELLKAFAKTIINLSIRTGEAIWKGITEGMMGGREDLVRKSARQIFQTRGGEIYRSSYAAVEGKATSLEKVSKGPFDLPAFVRPDQLKLYKQAEKEAAEIIHNQTVESVFKGFAEDTKKYFGDALEGISESSTEAADIIQKNLQALHSKDAQRKMQQWWEGIKTAAQPVVDTVTELKNRVVKIFSFGEKGTPKKPQGLQPEISKEDFTRDKLEAYRSMYSEMGRMSEQLYQVEKRLLDLQLEEYKSFIDDKVALAAWYNEQVRKLDIEKLKSSGSFVSGIKSAQREMANDIKTFGEIGSEVAYAVRDAFADSFADMILNARKFKDAATGFLRAVAASIIQIMAMQVATGLMVGAGVMKTPAKHLGGAIGAGSTERTVPKMLFSNAPRLHAGLQPDEFPAILQRGESVIPKGQSAGTTVEVNVINQTSRPVSADKGKIEFDGEKYVTNVVIKDIHNYGPMRNAIQEIGARQ